MAELKTDSKVPLTVEEMSDIRFLIDVMRRNLPETAARKLGRDIEDALYRLDHSMENAVTTDVPDIDPRAEESLPDYPQYMDSADMGEC